MTSRWQAFAATVFAIIGVLGAATASCTSSSGGAPAGEDSAPDRTSPVEAGLDSAPSADHTAPDATTQADATALPDADGGTALVDASDATLVFDADAAGVTAASALIGPTGGTVRLSDGTQVVVPAGALTATVLVALTPIAAPSSGISIGATVRVDPVATALLVPAAITLPLTPGLVPLDADTTSLVVERSPDGVAAYVPIASTVDLVAGTVTASTVSFGAFAAMEESSALFITTASPLPVGTVGTAYTTSFTAVGGSPPYTWSIPGGSAAPPGLALDNAGTLAGTPTAAGRTLFFVLVTDSHAHATQAVFECDVSPMANINPTPVLTSISPTSATVGSAAQSIVLTGSGFATASVVQLDGASLATVVSSSTQLVATIPASSLTATGTHAVTVITPTPGGGTSASQTFTVTPGTLAPTLSSVSPTSVPQNAPDTQITLTGTNFVATSFAQIGTQALSSQYVSATQLLAIIPAVLLTSTGTLNVAVVTPPPGGGTSTTKPIQVFQTVAPTITSISPSTIPGGSTDTMIKVTGTNFDATGRLFLSPYTTYDGKSLTPIQTTVTSSTSATAKVRQCMLEAQGTLTITYAANAADAGAPPNGGPSASIALVVGLPEAGSSCDPATCASQVPNAICENTKCCGKGLSVNGNPSGCCSGFSVMNGCQSRCMVAGQPNPQSYSQWCCADYDAIVGRCY